MPRAAAQAHPSALFAFASASGPILKAWARRALPQRRALSGKGRLRERAQAGVDEVDDGEAQRHAHTAPPERAAPEGMRAFGRRDVRDTAPIGAVR